MGFFDFAKKEEFAKIDELSKKLSEANEINTKQSEEIENLISTIATKDSTINDLENTVSTLNNEVEKLKKKSVEEKKNGLKDLYNQELNIYKQLKAEVEVLRDSLEAVECGVYTPMFNFDDSEEYKNNMLRANEEAKKCIKDGRATQGGEPKIRARLEKVILLGFNGVCDSCISNVKWNNVFQCEERIKKSYESINKAYKDFGFYITTEYLEYRLKELHLAYEFKLKKQREKEEQDIIKQTMREEEKAYREIQTALIKAEAEEKKYLERIEKASITIQTLQGEKLEKAMAQIAELEARLIEARENKERALSMAEQTKRGHVYVISNIGSFGENVYKIGLTRRLDPMDRVRELGDASVPFPFDVHAMIFSEDAPKLEAELHRRFSDRRVNMINNRKEFFNVTLEEIAEVVKEFNSLIEFTQVAEARDYRETKALKKTNTDNDEHIKDYPSELFAS